MKPILARRRRNRAAEEFFKQLAACPVNADIRAPYERHCPDSPRYPLHISPRTDVVVDGRLVHGGHALCGKHSQLFGHPVFEAATCKECIAALPSIVPVNYSMGQYARTIVDLIHDGDLVGARQVAKATGEGLDPEVLQEFIRLLSAMARDSLESWSVSTGRRIAHGPATYVTGDPFSLGYAWWCTSCCQASKDHYRWRRAARRAADRHSRKHDIDFRYFIMSGRAFDAAQNNTRSI